MRRTFLFAAIRNLSSTLTGSTRKEKAQKIKTLCGHIWEGPWVWILSAFGFDFGSLLAPFGFQNAENGSPKHSSEKHVENAEKVMPCDPSIPEYPRVIPEMNPAFP